MSRVQVVPIDACLGQNHDMLVEVQKLAKN
jgi:hypothetical protein